MYGTYASTLRTSVHAMEYYVHHFCPVPSPVTGPHNGLRLAVVD